MADNTVLPGAGNVIAADEIGSAATNIDMPLLFNAMPTTPHNSTGYVMRMNKANGLMFLVMGARMILSM